LARPIRDGGRVRLHAGSGNVAGRVALLQTKKIEAGEAGLAQLRLEEPVFVCAGDRFIVRDWAEEFTLGGGVVLDPHGRRPGFRRARQRQFLVGRAEGGLEVGCYVRTAVGRDLALPAAQLLAQSIFSATEVGEALACLEKAREVQVRGGWVLSPPWWEGLIRLAEEAVGGQHAAHPEQGGLVLSELRRVMEKRLPQRALFEELTAELERRGYVRSGTVIRSGQHRPALPPHLEAAGARLRALLSSKPFEPPSKRELAPDTATQQALRFLRECGETVELGEDLVVLAESYERMRAAVVRHIRDKGPATVSDLRQCLGTTRRVMMPLLERLDREGTTLRQGDHRSLGSRSMSELR